jgi:hypothetical protein
MKLTLAEALLTPAQRARRASAERRAAERQVAAERRAYAKAHGFRWLGGKVFEARVRIDPAELAAARAECCAA